MPKNIKGTTGRVPPEPTATPEEIAHALTEVSAPPVGYPERPVG